MASPQVPSWLGEVGKRVWRKLVKQLPSISDNQLDTLALLCNSWDLYYSANEDVKTKGRLITAQNGRLFVNPAINIMVEERKTILKISKLFGLAPDDGAKDELEDSPFKALLETREDD